MVVPLNGNINVLQSIPGAHVSAAGNECNGRAQINLPPFFCPLHQLGLELRAMVRILLNIV